MSGEDCQAREWSFKDWIDAHPDEKIHIRSWLTVIWFLLFLIIGFGFWTADHYSGYPYNIVFGKDGVSGLFLLETCALFATFGVSVAYTREISRETGPDGAMGGQGATTSLVSIGVWSTINCGVIILAFIFLFLYVYTQETYFWLYLSYVICTCVVFSIFTRLDFLTMHKGTKHGIARNYWALFAFCDGPAAFSFAMLIIYTVAFHYRSGGIPENIVGGAVAMQLMIADAIYLIVSSNFCFWLYKYYVCKDVAAQ